MADKDDFLDIGRIQKKQIESLNKALAPPAPSQCCPCLNKDGAYYWPFKNPKKLNGLSFGGIKDLNYNSKDHGKFLLSQRKSSITKGQRGKKLSLIRGLFHLVMSGLIEP